MTNMVFSTTVVTSGHAEAIVVATGMDTSVGKIAKMIMNDDAPETPLQIKLGEVGKKLGLAALGICFIIFIIGIFKNISPIEMFMTSVGLAVAAIPEGLPAIVTILLSIGVTKMAKQNSIVKRLPAVETLGSSNVICSDKTGTLTQNKMTVTQVFSNNIEQNIKFDKEILQLASMCTDCTINYKDTVQIVEGEATEKAIVEAAIKQNVNKDELYKKMQRINEVAFDSKRKLMTTVHKKGNEYKIITKGAPDVLLNRCNKIYLNGKIVSLDIGQKNMIIKENEKMANNALRVIAVAYLDIDVLPIKMDESIENNLIFVGLIGMIDPPRPGVKEAVETCRQAGIKTVMITGDHITTATAIAKELGILKLGDKTITGEELEKISQKNLEDNIMNYTVFARVSPEHKLRIIKAFRAKGNVVAMTGDGVNDAPALKNADIGIAMGKNGTDVAKNAADMILIDDNFVTIVEAVRNGRCIYENIKKAVHFLLATNIGEIVAIFLGLILGWDTPLLAIQLLWINLVTDSLPAIALGMEPMDKDIMHRKPQNATKSIFADGLWGKIIVEGCMIGILTLLAFSIGNNLYGIKVARTMAFSSLSLLELIHSINIRTEESIFKTKIFDNIYLVGALALGIVLQLIVIKIPQIAIIFGSVVLNSTQCLIVALIAISPIIIVELQKKINEYRFGKIQWATSIVKRK